jgi:hypothetical protein
MRRLSVRRVVPVGLLLPVALAACGGGGNPLGQVVDAANATRGLSGTSYYLTLAGERLGPPSARLPTGKAAYDLRAGVGYEALTVQPRAGGKRTIYVDFLPSGVFVAPWPTPPGLLPPGKIWIAVPFAGAGAPRPTDPLPAQLEGLSPELALDEIAWGARSASSLGTRTVNHVPMHEYLVSVDLAKARSSAQRAGRRAIAAAIASELRASRTGRAAIKVWVTGPGHVGKIEATPPGTRLGRAVFQFTSFDARFNRNRPRASESVPLGKIADPSSRSLWTIATAG